MGDELEITMGGNVLRARILVILRADHPPGEMAAIPCGGHFQADFKIAVFGG